MRNTLVAGLATALVASGSIGASAAQLTWTPRGNLSNSCPVYVNEVLQRGDFKPIEISLLNTSSNSYSITLGVKFFAAGKPIGAETQTVSFGVVPPSKVQVKSTPAPTSIGNTVQISVLQCSIAVM